MSTTIEYPSVPEQKHLIELTDLTVKLLEEIRQNVKEGNLQATKRLVDSIDIKKSDKLSKMFFHNGVFLNLVVKHGSMEMLEYVKTRYEDCMCIMTMPEIVYASKLCIYTDCIVADGCIWSKYRKSREAIEGTIVNEKYIRNISSEKIMWLVENNCLNKKYLPPKELTEEEKIEEFEKKRLNHILQHDAELIQRIKDLLSQKEFRNILCAFVEIRNYQSIVWNYKLGNSHWWKIIKHCNKETLSQIFSLHNCRKLCKEISDACDYYKKDIFQDISFEKIQWLYEHNFIEPESYELYQKKQTLRNAVLFGIKVLVISTVGLLCYEKGFSNGKNKKR